jgi:hypothetical protein
MNIPHLFRNGIMYGFASGFMLGCIPNDVRIKYNNNTYRSIPFPLLTGVTSSLGIVLSPLLLISYFCNSVYFDKLYDKYDIDIQRYHQYDGNNNKYAYPSIIKIDIKNVTKTN